MNQTIPWVEKYRPDTFDNIILGENNEQIINSILMTNEFPNLLFFGPPGTGKTTTVTNLINAYQEQNNEKHKELVIHLNASDDRGIDIIRNQIANFVNSKYLFNKGMKFVILDEVDYMTKTAQLALKYIIENNSKNTRFCLICNYITKIDNSLQHEFVRMKFNKLPRNEIYKHLLNIIEKENIVYNYQALNNIIDFYESDMRSMINTLQNNAYSSKKYYDENELYKLLFNIIINKSLTLFEKKINYFLNYYNIEKKQFIIRFFYYLLKQQPNNITNFLDFYEILIKTDIYSSKFNEFFYKNIEKNFTS